MNTIPQAFDDEETPTRPTAPFPSRWLVAAARIARLAEDAEAALARASDDVARRVASESLVRIRQLAQELCR